MHRHQFHAPAFDPRASCGQSLCSDAKIVKVLKVLVLTLTVAMIMIRRQIQHTIEPNEHRKYLHMSFTRGRTRGIAHHCFGSNRRESVLKISASERGARVLQAHCIEK